MCKLPFTPGQPTIGRYLILVAVGLTSAAPGRSAVADVFQLDSGGQVVGKLVDRGAAGQYVIESDDGATITLTKKQVRHVEPQEAEELEYARRSRKMQNTVEEHRAMAEWCKEHKLGKLADHHRRQILKLDSDDEEARLSLGYQKNHGRWMTRDDIMTARGLKLYKGDYRTPQDIALRQREERREQAEADWIRQLRMWRGWLGGRRSAEAADEIAAISDPHATVAIVKELKRENDQRVRDLLTGALAKLEHPLAIRTLVDFSLDDPSRDVRLQCLDYLVDMGRPISLTPYVKALQHPDNKFVNRAAEALRVIGNREAISPLIDALVTTHTYRNADAPPGQINASFSPSGGRGIGAGGGGLSVGGGPKVVKKQRQNYEVSRALVELSGGQNFLFDQKSWRRWFVNQQIRDYVDARRDK